MATGRLQHAWVDAKLNYRVVAHFIFHTSWVYVAFGLFVLVLFLLQWLFNIDQLLEIVLGDNPLSVADRIDFVLDGFINIFRYANDFIPVAMISIAFLQALAITLLLRIRRSRAGSKQALPLGLSVLSVGCVACGGSILTPVLSLLASSVSVAFAETLSRLLLVAALVLSYKSLTSIALMTASLDEKNKKRTKKHVKKSEHSRT